MAILNLGNNNSAFSGSFSGSFQGDGSGLTNVSGGGGSAFPFTGDAQITGSLTISGSLHAFTLDSDSVILGKDAGKHAAATAENNVIIGVSAGISASNDNNVLIGKQAGEQVTGDGSDNIFIGFQAGQKGADKQENIAIGRNAHMGYSTSDTSDSNVSIGYYAGRLFQNSNLNTAIGYYAGHGNGSGGSNALRNVFLGAYAGYNHWNGIQDNIYVGYYAGAFNQQGDRNIIIGSGSTANGNPSDQLRIGHSTLHVISGSLTTGDIIFASTASADYFVGDGSQLTNLPASSAFPFTGDAQITGSLEISGSLKMIRPANKLDLSIGGNIIMGKEAGNSISDDRSAIFLGYKAGYTNTSPNANIAIGYGAGGSLGTNASQQNIFMGYLAGAGNTSIGSITSRMSAASNNIGMGYQALLYLTSGDENIALGSTVMRQISTGGNNIAFGSTALYNTDTGNHNIGIGKHAGSNQTSGDGNITIGSGSLGVAGESNQLRIGQGNGDALIHGDFASQSLSINGSGSTVFDVIGSQGTLFSVDDDLSGTLFTANDISGLPVLEASASGELYFGKSPQSLYTTAVISSTTANITQSIYGLSTSSYEGVFVDYTATSASNARAGNMTAIWNGSSLNFTETTTTDIGDTSNLIMQVAISQSQAQVQSYSTAASYKIKTIIRSI